MRIWITGGSGQLGHELSRVLRLARSALGEIPRIYQGAEIVATNSMELDITNAAAVDAFARSWQWDLILHCAAMTRVDACESDPEAAMRINAIGARNVAMAARCPMVHISTDYVFSGTANTPYREWDKAEPNTVYGKSKLLGEQYVREHCPQSFILRTAWLYGYAGNNFVKNILRQAREHTALRVVNDQTGCPTNAEDLAHHVLLVAATREYGIYHCVGSGSCSWYDFAQEILKTANMPGAIAPCSTRDYARTTARPQYSVLENCMLRCTTGDFMRPWEESLADYMQHYDRESGEFKL